MRLVMPDATKQDVMSFNSTRSYRRCGPGRLLRSALFLTCCLLCALAVGPSQGANLLVNPGFEATPRDGGAPPGWDRTGPGAAQIVVVDKEAHAGKQSVAIPAESAVVQRIADAKAGAYILRCWVKSESDQPVTLLVQDPDRPWSAYSCTELQVPKGQWTQLQAFCALDRNGALEVMLGGMSGESRPYHGIAGVMSSAILMDDCELIRYEQSPSVPVAVWDAKVNLSAMPDWSGKGAWSPVQGDSVPLAGSPLFQARDLAGTVRETDGALELFAVRGDTLKQRAVVVPKPVFAHAKCSVIHSGDNAGLRVTSGEGGHSYTAWLTPQGLVRIEAGDVPAFEVQSCEMRYGILPSLVGSDICYDPKKFTNATQISLPSTQWFVGLVDGYDSMLVAAWDTDSQAVALGVAGSGDNRMFDRFTVATDKAGFSISFVEHRNIWHKEPLQEDWLDEYTTVAWQRPFPARWMGEFFVSTGGRPYFDEPYMQYAFPFANAKTRMWGVWFEDWHHYPFWFDRDRTIFHFEKGYVPKGDALVYFLEPAAADLYSPCEILEQALGPEKAAALLDFDANGLRKLPYSTPPDFMYDRPVCATTTHLSKIPQGEKATVGVNLATHLYEFVRDIRGRIDQYVTFFDGMRNYLESQDKAHPELHPYIAEFESMVSEAKSKSADIYGTPLSDVQAKSEAMKKQLSVGQGDGYDCGNLDLRPVAGDQDDLCRHYNRLVLRLAQTAALECGDSPDKAVIATRVWEQSRLILRQPVRWEARRTLYFFEP
jgi:hypothetical protein